MKKHVITVLTLLAIPWHLAYSQALDFEVHYGLTTHTTYKVKEADLHLLLPQDTIKLMPESKKELIHEQFFNDGSTRIEANLSYPNGLLEDWIEPIDKLVTTNDKIEAYKDNKLLYTEAIDQPTAYDPPETFAPYYLATNNWQLPLTKEDEAQYQLAGYVIEDNTMQVLSLRNSTMLLRYDKQNLSETLIKFDESGSEIFRKLTFYEPDKDGYLLYDLIVTTSIDIRTQPCIEKITYEIYDNVIRTFHNPACAPTMENGFVSSKIEPISAYSIAANQIHGTNTIYLTIPSDISGLVFGEVKDLYGGIVIENIEIDTSYPYIDLGELPTGVYHFALKQLSIAPCKFLFQP